MFPEDCRWFRPSERSLFPLSSRRGAACSHPRSNQARRSKKKKKHHNYLPQTINPVFFLFFCFPPPFRNSSTFGPSAWCFRRISGTPLGPRTRLRRPPGRGAPSAGRPLRKVPVKPDRRPAAPPSSLVPCPLSLPRSAPYRARRGLFFFRAFKPSSLSSFV